MIGLGEQLQLSVDALRRILLYSLTWSAMHLHQLIKLYLGYNILHFSRSFASHRYRIWRLQYWQLTGSRVWKGA